MSDPRLAFFTVDELLKEAAGRCHSFACGYIPLAKNPHEQPTAHHRFAYDGAAGGTPFSNLGLADALRIIAREEIFGSKAKRMNEEWNNGG